MYQIISVVKSALAQMCFVSPELLVESMAIVIRFQMKSEVTYLHTVIGWLCRASKLGRPCQVDLRNGDVPYMNDGIVV